LRPYLPPEKLFVARNTIDLEPLLSQYDELAVQGKVAVRGRLGIRPDDAVIAFVGRLVPQKGTLLLIETFARIRAQRNATLLIIGKGPDQPAMEEYVAQHSVEDVRFLGPLPDKDAAPYLFAADVMLMPGYLGLVINQAFALGLPVVSRRNPIGVRYHSPEVEYVEHGRTGLLSDGDDAQSLAQAVHKVLADSDRFSRDAHEYARANLTKEAMVDGLEAAIEFAENHEAP
jgi:glycosyltransferase involved in cell wall biosynthesis